MDTGLTVLASTAALAFTPALAQQPREEQDQVNLFSQVTLRDGTTETNESTACRQAHGTEGAL